MSREWPGFIVLCFHVRESSIEEVADQARVSSYLSESAGVVCAGWTHRMCGGSV